MKLLDIYKLGKINPITLSFKNDEQRLKFAQFPYTSKEVNGAALLILITTILLTFASSYMSKFLVYFFMFVGFIITIITYIYPTHIYYSQVIMEYNEEMIKAIMRISNYISMSTSMDYAVVQTAKSLRGPLKKQFDDITNKLSRKIKTNLGDAIEEYVEIWNKINPIFVKSIRLLQTATMAPEEDRIKIIEETMESLMLDYSIAGKRAAEDLTTKSRSLIAFGVLLPVTSLMLLPLLSIFLPELIKPPLLVFLYNVLFPVGILLMVLAFSVKRIQVDTIVLAESPEYRKMPVWIYFACIAIIIIFAVPAVMHLNSINMNTPESAKQEYELFPLFSVWLGSMGIMLAIYLFSSYYVRRYSKLWNEVRETEQDLPHLLQVFATFLSLNVSVENIFGIVVDDYKKHGFSKHPVVKIFSTLSRKLITSKDSLENLVDKVLKTMCPSKQVAHTLSQIISFTNISQESSAKVTKMIRQESISIQKLEDYMQTLLAETVSLINITIIMLTPLLCAIAVIMSIVIVKSLIFISDQLADIQNAFGSNQIAGLSLVNITAIIPPTVIEAIISIYFIEVFLVLSLFTSNIKVGSDTFNLMKTIKSNILGYLIYSSILFLGYLAIVELFFKGVLT